MKKIKNSLTIRILNLVISIIFLCPNLTYSFDTYHLSALRPPLVCGEVIEEVVGFQDAQADLLIRDEVEKIRMGFVGHDLGNIFSEIFFCFDDLRVILQDLGVENLSELCKTIGKEWEDLSKTSDIFSIPEGLSKTTNDFFTKVESCLNGNKIKYKMDREDVRKMIRGINEELEKLKGLRENISLLAGTEDIGKLIDFYKKNFLHPAFNINTKLCYEGLKFERWHKDEAVIIIGIINNLIMTAGRIASEARMDDNITIRTAKQDDAWIKIEVSDTGPGFPEEILRCVFKKEVTTKDYGNGGKGLKLTGDYVLLKRAKIQIDTKNEDGKVYRLVLDGRLKKRTLVQILDGSGREEVGTTVTLWLPAEKIFGYRLLNRAREVVQSL